MLQLASDNPINSSFYYVIIAIYLLILGITYGLVHIFKIKVRKRLLSESLDPAIQYTDHFIKQKDYLKIKYLSAYILTRASMWAKAPYLFILYSQYHGFTVNEIEVLYVIDAISGLISGPIFGSLADKFGRKLFCLNYCGFVILNLSLRLTGSKPLAYIAQVLTGFGSGLINTTFESWVVFESRKVFNDKEMENERFLRRLFKNQNLYDAIISLIISGISAMIFTNFGMIVTIVFSMFLSICAFFLILFLWEENKPNAIDSDHKNYESLKEALRELKKRDVLTIGLIESIFQATLNLFIFLWTPILELSSSYSEINVGFIFICYVILMIVGTAMFELFIMNIKAKYYLSISAALFIGMAMWYLVYTVDSFIPRIIFLSVINGLCGFFLPLNSIIKSKILIEKHRATIMSIFRIPVNAYVIAILLSLKYMNVFTVIFCLIIKVCLIAFFMMAFAFLLGLSLYCYPPRVLEPEKITVCHLNEKNSEETLQ